MRPPPQIYLQWYGDEDPNFLAESEKESIDPNTGEVSWWLEKIHPHDIAYVRRDLFEEVTDAFILQNDRLRAELEELRRQLGLLK